MTDKPHPRGEILIGGSNITEVNKCLFKVIFSAENNIARNSLVDRGKKVLKRT